MEKLFAIVLIVIAVLLLFGTGLGELVIGLIAGLFGLIVGLIAGAVGLLAGLLGAAAGLIVVLAVLAVPIAMIFLAVFGLVKLLENA
ncbi:hypothetical protein GF377_01905 [candidate division GN15 bacterium]|nr:hypothetical protein [candidate division GN15 bacterium]